MAIFLLVLPDALAVSHGSTWTEQMEEREPVLDDVDIRPLQHVHGGLPRSEGAVGRNFVSLRFWQMRDEQSASPEFLYRNFLAARVGNALNPETMGDAAMMEDAEGAGYEPYRTVVEAVTFVACEAELRASESKREPLTRCIDVLTQYHRAYRAVTGEHVPELTYERLHPWVLWYRRPAFDLAALPTLAGLIMLENRNYALPASETLDGPAHHAISQFNLHLSAGSPFALYAERRLEADIEVWTTGRMAESIMQTSIAAEVLFDGLLGLMLWEEHTADLITVEEAAGVFSSDITPRLKREYARRLGGNWSFARNPMKGWFDNIAATRNRVVHGGHRPDKHAAADAYEALLAVERFVADRLADRWKRYPRTSWLFLGHDGFERRGKLAAAQAWFEDNGGNVIAWAREYQAWRVEVNGLVTRRRR